MIQHRKKGKDLHGIIGREISLQVTDGCGRLGFSFSYRNSCLLIKERHQKYSS